METEKQNGLVRCATKKNKGYWLARWKDQEKVFYDGVFGTETAAKNAALAWYRTISAGKDSAEFDKKVDEFFDWIDGKKEEYGEKIHEEVWLAATDILGNGKLDPSLFKKGGAPS